MADAIEEVIQLPLTKREACLVASMMGVTQAVARALESPDSATLPITPQLRRFMAAVVALVESGRDADGRDAYESLRGNLERLGRVAWPEDGWSDPRSCAKSTDATD